MIRLIASDLDGTLLGHDFRFRPRTLAALEAAAAAGIEVVFVTGRPHRWLNPLRDQLDYDSYAICSNGAVVYHLGANAIESVHLTDMSAVAAVHPVLVRAFPGASFTLETLDTVYLQGGQGRGPTLTGARVVEGPYDEVLARNEGVVKYLMRLEGADPNELYARMLPMVRDHLALTIGIKGVPLMEMAAPGMNKGQTLALFAAERGITPAEVAAFGDMPNDLEMIQWAGQGYAMASGSSRLIDAVGRVCPAFDEDGVAQVVEKIVAEQKYIKS